MFAPPFHDRLCCPPLPGPFFSHAFYKEKLGLRARRPYSSKSSHFVSADCINFFCSPFSAFCSWCLPPLFFSSCPPTIFSLPAMARFFADFLPQRACFWKNSVALCPLCSPVSLFSFINSGPFYLSSSAFFLKFDFRTNDFGFSRGVSLSLFSWKFLFREFFRCGYSLPLIPQPAAAPYFSLFLPSSRRLFFHLAQRLRELFPRLLLPLTCCDGERSARPHPFSLCRRLLMMRRFSPRSF